MEAQALVRFYKSRAALFQECKHPRWIEAELAMFDADYKSLEDEMEKEEKEKRVFFLARLVAHNSAKRRI